MAHPAGSALVRRLADHDTSAIPAVYDRQAGEAMGLALRIESALAAAEVVAAAFMRLWRVAGAFDPDRVKLRDWLLLTAYSCSPSPPRR